MAPSEEERGAPPPSEQRGGSTPDEAEAREKGEWAATSDEGVVPAELGGSDAPREMLDEDPELESDVLGETTGSDEPATEEGIDPAAGDQADATTDGRPRASRRRRARHEGHRTGMTVIASTEWVVGLVIGVVVILVAAAIVITIVALASRIAGQARTAEEGVEAVRKQTAELGGVARINDSGVRVLHAARALRKVAVGK